jgi:hypothetical protein
VAVAITGGFFSAAAASSSILVGKYGRGHVIVEFESESLAHLFGPGLLEEQQRKRDVLNDEVAGIEHHATDRYSQLVTRNVEARKHLDKMEAERTNFLSHLGDALGLSKEERDTGTCPPRVQAHLMGCSATSLVLGKNHLTIVLRCW